MAGDPDQLAEAHARYLQRQPGVVRGGRLQPQRSQRKLWQSRAVDVDVAQRHPAPQQRYQVEFGDQAPEADRFRLDGGHLLDDKFALRPEPQSGRPDRDLDAQPGFGLAPNAFSQFDIGWHQLPVSESDCAEHSQRQGGSRQQRHANGIFHDSTISAQHSRRL